MSRKSGDGGPKVVVSGYYGYDNCGDEAVLLAMIICLRRVIPDIRITVLSGNPAMTRALYGVGAARRWNPFAVALRILTCGLFISGGGSLLQDVSSSRSLRYYLAVIRLAEILGKRVMIYSQGIGPLKSEKNRARVAKAMNRCHEITVRDERSAQLLREIGVTREVKVFCDPVMALTSSDVDGFDDDESNGDVGKSAAVAMDGAGDKSAAVAMDGAGAAKASDDGDSDSNSNSNFDSNSNSNNDSDNGSDSNIDSARKPLLLTSIRSWNDDRHIRPVAEFLDSRIEKGWDVLLVPAHYPYDMEALRRISESMSGNPQIADKCLTAREFLDLSARADAVFSMRLHGLVFAFAAGAPMIGLSYDPKVDAFMEQIGFEKYCLPFDGFDCAVADRMLDELLLLPPQLVRRQEEQRREMRAIAAAPAYIAAELLERKAREL